MEFLGGMRDRDPSNTYSEVRREGRLRFNGRKLMYSRFFRFLLIYLLLLLYLFYHYCPNTLLLYKLRVESDNTYTPIYILLHHDVLPARDGDRLYV